MPRPKPKLHSLSKESYARAFPRFADMIVAVAMILDGIWGEPDALWKRAPHPAVLLGRLVGTLDKALNTGTARRARGVLTVLVLIGVA